MDEILNEIQLVNISYEQAIKTGDKIPVLETGNKKKYVLSKYDPIKEAQRLVQKQEFNKDTLWIVLGFNLGYIVKEIINAVGKHVKIFIIEPKESTLQLEKKITEVQKWEQYKGIEFFTGTDFNKLTKLYKKNLAYSNINNVKVIGSKEYEVTYVRYFKKIIELVAEVRAQMLINQNTAEKFNRVVIKNIIENRTLITEGHNFEEHKQKYLGSPAIIVSAGPSLEKNLHLIKKFKGLIFTGSRSLPALMGQGVDPDFIVTLDPQEIVYDTFQGYTNTTIPLITSPSVSNRVLSEIKGPKYFVENDSGLAKEIIGINLPYLKTGGSVATLCLSAAQYVGCNPIVFVGQDLAYTNNQTHAGSCKIGSEEFVDTHKDLKLIDGYYGDKVYSTNALIGYLKWIEEFIEEDKKTIYINATEGGGYIKGSLHISLEEVIQKHCSLDKLAIVHPPQGCTIGDIKQVNTRILESLEEVNKLNLIAIQGERLSYKLIEEYQQFKGNRTSRINNFLQKLKGLELQMEKLEKSYLAYTIFSQVYNRLNMNLQYQPSLTDNIIQKESKHAKLHYDTYQRIKEETKRWIELIEKTMEENDGA